MVLQEDKSATLVTNNDQYLFQPIAFAQNQRDEVRDLGDKVGALQAEPGMKQQTFIAVKTYDAHGNGDGKTVNTLACGTHAAGSHLTKTVINLGHRYIVRRLTPTECARLQGFADRWGDIDEKGTFTPEEFAFWHEVRNTHAAINGKKVQEYTEQQMLTWYNKLHTDSAEYKMWGNGIALPPALYCMQGMAETFDREVTKNEDHA